MLDAVMLVLREVLEAALFVSLLLALGRHLSMSRRWAAVAVPMGLLASWLASHEAATLAEAFDGAGQECLNGALYLIAVACFVAIDIVLAPALVGRSLRAPKGALATLFVLIVSASMAREGSEVWIYLSSFRGKPALAAALTGSVIGTGIGLSLCALVYYSFAALRTRTFFVLFFVIAALVAGGLAMQVARLALQVGWLDSGRPLWDSGALISEQSWFGQFLHALFGYDANPDRVQALFYFAVLAALMAGTALRLVFSREPRRA